MTDSETVRARLSSIEVNLRFLAPYCEKSGNDLRKNQTELYAVLHALQLIAQSVLDVGSHVLANAGIGDVDEYRDAILRLSDIGVYPREFAEKIAGIAGLRNVIVHEYLRVDADRIAAALKRLNDVREYCSFVRIFIEK